MVFEFMGGGNLNYLLKRFELRAAIGLRYRILWLLQIASALWHLHTSFCWVIRHWDIKPSNILLDTLFKIAKLADMGLAKFLLNS